MKIYNKITQIDKSSIALGFFDGIHLGHRVVLKNAINFAAKNNCKSLVVMFKEHPLSFLCNEKIPMILTLDERIKILEEIGIDNLILLDFEKYANMKAINYLKNVLIDNFHPLAITTGYNHSFGYKKEGNSILLKNNSKNFNYKYFEVPPFLTDNTVVSCTEIRKQLSLGNFYCANKLLGYNFFIKGIVVKGEQLAAKLGFPSANIYYPEEKVKIPHGVYFVKINFEEKEYNGILNHGFAPTVNNNSLLKTEIHILDFSENIYGKQIKVSFITKIRNQMKFSSVEDLKHQINKDISFVNVYKCFLNNQINFSYKNFSF